MIRCLQGRHTAKIADCGFAAEVFPVPFDVFISHASKDKTIANAVCARLEAAGIRCWIAPRDIVAGTPYGEAIIDAIQAAKVMVLVFSSSANASVQIPKEIERAVSNGVAILPFRIEDVAPGKSLDYFIGSVHWLDAMTPPMEQHLDNLAATVQKLLPGLAARQGQAVPPVPVPTPTPVPTPAPVPTPIPPPPPAPPSKTLLIGVAGAIVLAAIVLAVMFLRHPETTSDSQTNPVTTVAPDASNNLSPGGNPNPAVNPSRPGSQTVTISPPSTTKAASDPIVGCYQWFNNQPVFIRSDHTMMGGPIPGHWQLVNAALHTYMLTWMQPRDTIAVAPDQRSLSGQNSYGNATTGTRMAGFSGLIGTWRWENGVPVVISADGRATAGSIHGVWQPINAAQGTYAIMWDAPVDNVALLAGGTRIAGKDNYGVAISGIRTEPCDQN
jgi:hypothetical protein